MSPLLIAAPDLIGGAFTYNRGITCVFSVRRQYLQLWQYYLSDIHLPLSVMNTSSWHVSTPSFCRPASWVILKVSSCGVNNRTHQEKGNILTKGFATSVVRQHLS